jgi:hypothetical protein
MSSQEPNLHNVPRDPRFRALVRAKDGHVILTFDYNAIELRISAVLAERAIADILAHLRGEVGCGNTTQAWFMRLEEVGYHAKTQLASPSDLAT